MKFSVGDYVLLKSSDRHQTKLDPKLIFNNGIARWRSLYIEMHKVREVISILMKVYEKCQMNRYQVNWISTETIANEINSVERASRE